MHAGTSLVVLTGIDGEIERLRRLVCSAVKLATHLRPDLDALLAIWMCQRVRQAAGLEPIEVLFIPANTDGVEEGILAVDVGKGSGIQRFGEGHSIKMSSHGGSAAMAIFRVLPDLERNILGSLTHAVSYADEKGENVHNATFKSIDGLAEKFVNLAEEVGEGSPEYDLFLDAIDYIKTRGGRWARADIKNQVLTSNDWFTHQSLTHVLGDRELLRWWGAKYNGMVEAGIKKREGELAADKATYVLGRQLAILPFGAPLPTSTYAYRRGAKVVLFSSSLGGDRWTLGLARNPDPPGGPIDLTILRDILEKNFPGIWVHPSGIMAGWASKAPLNCSKKEFEERRERFISVVTQGLAEALLSQPNSEGSTAT